MESTELTQKIGQIINAYRNWATEEYKAKFVAILADVTSPIEQLFGAALIYALEREVPELDWDYTTGADVSDAGAVVCSQAPVENYRIDFLITCKRATPHKPFRLAIECDGHDFHERTKAQAARDRSRDRRLTERGIVALRFTGSEIWADPVACASQVAGLVNDRVFFPQ